MSRRNDQSGNQLHVLHWELGVLFTPRTLARRNAAAPFAIGGGGGRVAFRLSLPIANTADDDADDALAELVTTRALARAARAERDGGPPTLVMPVPFELPPRPHPSGAEPWHSDGTWPARPDRYSSTDCEQGPAAPPFYGLHAAPAHRVP